MYNAYPNNQSKETNFYNLTLKIPEFPVSIYTGIRERDFDSKNAVFNPLQNSAGNPKKKGRNRLPDNRHTGRRGTPHQLDFLLR